jgi:hypothetical protein
LFQLVITHPDTYRLQIIYTRINRDRQNQPSFQNYYFHFDSLAYFNPASTVKLPLALLSLEKLNLLHLPGVTRNTAVRYDSVFSGQTKEYTDSTSETGLPSIAHFIRKAFLVSDNDAYNRMYEFVGQQQINRSLHEKGYTDARITHRFVGLSQEENRHTNPVSFINQDGSLAYYQPPAYNTDPFDFSHVIKIGDAYYNAKDSLIREPFDFTTRNNLSLKDLQQLLQSVLFPASVPRKQRFFLKEEDYRFLYQYLSQFPGETNYPKYDSVSYYDNYLKTFFKNPLNRHLPNGVRVFNKIGWAYGFLTDVAYIADFTHKVEYMLTATLYVNSDGVLNDDKYDYDSIGHPFLFRLGQIIYQYELQRKREFPPDLSRFIIPYEKREENKTPPVKEVDK